MARNQPVEITPDEAHGFLVALAVKALPDSLRPRGAYLWALIGVSALVSALGFSGGAAAALSQLW
jgi:hypothetical protein